MRQARRRRWTVTDDRFAMSPGLRFDDLSRLTVPHPKVAAFLPRATKRTTVRVAGGTVTIEDSVWIDPDGQMVPTRQIVAGGSADPGGATLNWVFKRARSTGS